MIGKRCRGAEPSHAGADDDRVPAAGSGPGPDAAWLQDPGTHGEAPLIRSAQIRPLALLPDVRRARKLLQL